MDTNKSDTLDLKLNLMAEDLEIIKRRTAWLIFLAVVLILCLVMAYYIGQGWLDTAQLMLNKAEFILREVCWYTKDGL